MHTAYKIVLACAWLLPGAGMAQASSHAADPGAAVPATTYRPLISYRPEAAPETPPDNNWAGNNATVAAYNSMALTMKMKGMQAPADAHGGHVGNEGQAAVSAPNPHAGHAGHAGHAVPDHKESP